jgi:hypothetical protein
LPSINFDTYCMLVLPLSQPLPTRRNPLCLLGTQRHSSHHLAQEERDGDSWTHKSQRNAHECSTPKRNNPESREPLLDLGQEQKNGEFGLNPDCSLSCIECKPSNLSCAHLSMHIKHIAIKCAYFDTTSFFFNATL